MTGGFTGARLTVLAVLLLAAVLPARAQQVPHPLAALTGGEVQTALRLLRSAGYAYD